MNRTTIALFASIALIGCEAPEVPAENEEVEFDESELEGYIDVSEEDDAADSATTESSNVSSTTTSTDNTAIAQPLPPKKKAPAAAVDVKRKNPAPAKKNGSTSRPANSSEAKAPLQSKTAPQSKISPERDSAPAARP